MLMLIGALETPAVAEMSTHTQPSSSPWHPIEQPLALKVGVTVGGIALIGLELWWFLNRDRTPKSLDQ
ncbi:MAG: hypothetical protein HC866_10580 [Leptolyngbyaceae cyanobacterium RU_5_1]|nr:hypothetical protein [Leptolyngbyaceae cyanobacterium RU_5_1]